MQPIRLLLAYAGVEYEDKRYNIGPAPDYERNEWLNDAIAGLEKVAAYLSSDKCIKYPFFGLSSLWGGK
jgi:hypothetical protein